jgi:hypothetical protein
MPETKATVLFEAQMKKLITALTTIAEFIEKKKPTTLPEAQHMLTLNNLIATEVCGE